MKKSNKLALMLFSVVLIFFISNLIYHKSSFVKNIRSFSPHNVYESQQNKVKVVCIIDPTRQATNKIVIDKRDKTQRTYVSEAFADVQQRDDFFKSMTFKSDTLFINANTVSICHPNSAKIEIKITLKNVEKVFYNESLISDFQN